MGHVPGTGLLVGLCSRILLIEPWTWNPNLLRHPVTRLVGKYQIAQRPVHASGPLVMKPSQQSTRFSFPDGILCSLYLSTDVLVDCFELIPNLTLPEVVEHCNRISTVSLPSRKR